MKQLMHRALRLLGFDLMRYPSSFSLEKRLMRLMAAHGVDLVLDVGANVGQFAWELGQAYAIASILVALPHGKEAEAG